MLSNSPLRSMNRCEDIRMTDKNMGDSEKFYLGFDFSTQQIKVIAIKEDLTVVYEDHVKFGTDLPEFRTTDGVHIHDDKVTVTSPTAMWVKALDMLLEKMKTAGFNFGRVVALSGDGQQHGSVYWKKGAREGLRGLAADKSLYDQLKDSFSIADSPIWMDASTTKQCRQLEEAVGGPMELSTITGSRGFERFTGTQIMKISQTQKDPYENTERISLVSSFAASLFLGDYAPIDLSDGSGMNLLDITTRSWSSKCLDACGADLATKLGEPVASQEIVGTISPYFVKKYGFSAECKVVAFTGDNPASLAGMTSKEGGIIASLGSSDALFLWLPNATPGLSGHVWVNPLDPKSFMALVCFKNSSLTRQRIMERNAGSWEKFEEILQRTPPGNNGNIGIYFDVKEIQPVVMGTFRYNQNNEKVETFPPEVEVRAILESQFLARLMYSKQCGLKIESGSRVLATGGASANKAILQVIADIFNIPVYTIDVPNSAGLGGCYRAKHAIQGGPFADAVKGLPEPVLAAQPTPGLEEMYEKMLARYECLEKQLAKEYES